MDGRVGRRLWTGGTFMRIGLLAAACLAILAGTLALSVPARADWVPTKPVEFVVMAGQGGGADKIARFIAGLVKKHNLFPVEAKVVNIPGKSGGEALAYLKSQAGNDHLLIFTLNSFFTVPLSRPELGIDILAFAPIARLGLDPFLLWVHSDRTDIRSIDDFALAARKADSWTMAGTGSMQEDELLTLMLNAVFRLDMKYHPREGGGDVAKLLAEKAVQSTVNNPAEIQAHHSARRVKPIAAFTRERLAQYPDTPTFWELGLELEYLMQRGVAGPPSMSHDAADFYSAVFEKVFQSPDWQSYKKRAGLLGEFLSGRPLREYWQAQLEIHGRLLEVARAARKPME
jgi:tripartite-type tricarboxylate transporter receptor subunit TctC